MNTPITSSDEELRYPVGRYQPPTHITAENRTEWLHEIATLPEKLRRAVLNLTDAQLNTAYRPGGWTIRQVVHHLADSHMNSYQRFRLALTENSPVVKTYDEAAWAELFDAKGAEIQPSPKLLEALHDRWVTLLSSLTDAQFARTFRHPEWGEVRLDWVLAHYAWHCRHHLAHITKLSDRAHW